MTEEKKTNGTQTQDWRGNLPVPVKALDKALEQPSVSRRIEAALHGTKLNMEMFRMAVLQFTQQNSDLWKCTPDSLALACIDCAHSGLLPDKVFGQAYIVRYADKAQFILGYKGMIQLAHRSGLVSGIHANVVYEADHFEALDGTERSIEHKPYIPKGAGSKSRGEAYAAYAVCKMKDGTVEFDILTRADIERIRSRSPSRNSKAWNEDWDEMAKKTAIRRLFKKLPMSVTDKAGLFASMEDEFEERGAVSHIIDGQFTRVEDVPPEETAAPEEKPQKTPRQSRRLAEAMRKTPDVEDRGNEEPPADEGGDQPAHGADGGADAGDHGGADGRSAEADAASERVLSGDDLEFLPRDDGPDMPRQAEPDTSAVEMPMKGSKPDVDAWMMKVADRLVTLPNEDLVRVFGSNLQQSRALATARAASKDIGPHLKEAFSKRIKELRETAG